MVLKFVTAIRTVNAGYLSCSPAFHRKQNLHCTGSGRLPCGNVCLTRSPTLLALPNRSFQLSESEKRFLRFKLEDKKNFNLMRDAVQPIAQEQPDKPALILTSGAGCRQEVTYGELFDASKALATALCGRSLSALGLGASWPEGRTTPRLALVVLPKIVEWWHVNLAASWCGLIISPGTSLLTGPNVEFRLRQSGADCIFCGPQLVAGVDEAERNLTLQHKLLKVVVGAHTDQKLSDGWVRYEDLISAGAAGSSAPCHDNKPDDVCQIFFTSGTTGQPKMVPHTHYNYPRGHQVALRKWLDLQPDDIFWNVSDTGWAKAAWSSLYLPLMGEATAFVHQMAKFDPAEMLAALQREPVSVLCAPPTAYRALVQLPIEDYELKCLRRCVSAGEPLNPTVMDTWKQKTGFEIYEGYGQSETTLMCATFPGMTIKPGSMGKPVEEYDVKILDEKLEEVPTGTEGQIAVKTQPTHPPGLFTGYFGNPEGTAKSFKGEYYLTGDRGHFDSDGYLWFVARDDDVIISSGYRIGPFEVESALLEHASVAEVGVIGVPDYLRGHLVKAFVVLSDEAARRTTDQHELEKLAKELQEHVKKITAPYKYPRQIEFVSSLPKTVSGKIRRVELRQEQTEST